MSVVVGQAAVFEQQLMNPLYTSRSPDWFVPRRVIAVATPAGERFQRDRQIVEEGRTFWMHREPPEDLATLLTGTEARAHLVKGPVLVDVTGKDLEELKSRAMPKALSARAAKAMEATDGTKPVEDIVEWWKAPGSVTIESHKSGRARTPRDPAPVKKIAEPVVDSKYLSRKIGKTSDIAALHRYREDGGSVLAYGPAGTGKTEVMIAAFGGEMRTISCHEDTVAADFIGDYVKMPDGSWQWFDHDLVVCMEQGLVLFVDDINRARMKQLAVLFPAMDGRREITVVAGGKRRTVAAAPGFMVVAGANLKTAGTELDPALTSRFDLKLEIKTSYRMAVDRLGVDSVLAGAAENLETRRLANEISWSPQMRDLLLAMRNVERLDMNAAVGSLINSAPMRDRDTVAEVMSKAFGRKMKGLSLS